MSDVNDVDGGGGCGGGCGGGDDDDDQAAHLQFAEEIMRYHYRRQKIDEVTAEMPQAAVVPSRPDFWSPFVFVC